MIKPFNIDVSPKNIYWTSDLHYNHKNISNESSWSDTSLCRPFSLVEMNEYIIDHIKSTVPKGGLLINCGDIAFGGELDFILNEISSHCKHLFVRGNHDHKLDSIVDIAYLNIGGQVIQVCHYPLESWYQQSHGSWMIHGHCHGSLQDRMDIKRLDGGFDTDLHGHKKYTLYSHEELCSIMSLKGSNSTDLIH